MDAMNELICIELAEKVEKLINEVEKTMAELKERLENDKQY